MGIFSRNILKELEKWKNKEDRKPLIIRGARQTGKTIAVNMFSKRFSQYVYLNLERESEKNLFEKSESIEQVIQGIEISKEKKLLLPDTLLFIDEIQNSQKAVKFLRFFYENYPNLFVIAAGSLLEALLTKDGFSFPVGRVEFLYLYPVTFDEFLLALGKEKMHEEFLKITINKRPSPILHKMASETFAQYAMVGGMPAVVSEYLEKMSFQSIADIKEDLITAIKDDVAKYSRMSESKYLRHVIEYAPYYVGERIKYEKFGNSAYHSREIKHAFELLEYAMIVQRIYGSYSTTLPIQPNFRVSPKILYLDMGLVIHKLGLTQEMVFAADLNSLFKGKFSEQIAGQALMSQNFHRRFIPCFWYRNAPGSTSEIDYSYPFKEMILPVEVKSGKTGSLRSLHQFMASTQIDMAIRIYSGELSTDTITTGSRSFKLISIPFYLLWRINELID